MSEIPKLRRLLRIPLDTRAQVTRDVDAELDFHLEMRAADLVGEGMTAEAARAQAEREFGNLTQAREVLRVEAESNERKDRRVMVLDELQQDIRYGWRTLLAKPAFFLVTVGTIALGIAATTTVFTVFRGVLLRPLPIREPERVVVPHSVNTKEGNEWSVTYADFTDWQERKLFEAVAVYQETGTDLRLTGEAERVSVAVVSSDFFRALGAAAAAGRLLGPADFGPEAARAFVISYDLWQSRFQGDPSVIGRSFGSTRPATLVGVLARGAAYPVAMQTWFPLRTPEGGIPADWMERDNYVFAGIARLHPGVPLEQTRAQMAALAATIEQQNPKERANVSTTAVPILQDLLGPELPRVLMLMLAAVGFVLLIGCANVANLLLVRGAGRRREFAVRIAMGARPGRIARQLLTESLLIGGIGGALGVLLSKWGVHLLLTSAPVAVPRFDQVQIDPLVLAVGIGASLLASVFFGLAPVLQAARVPAAETMQESTNRSAGSRRSQALRRSLVIAELALSVTLLIAAGLLVRSLQQLHNVELGFRTDNVATFSLRLSPVRYPDNQAATSFYRQLVEKLTQLPNVSSAAIGSALPVGGGGFYLGRAYLREGQAEPPEGNEVSGPWTVISPRYFETMGMPLSRGREFTAADDSASTPVAVINQRFARAMFGNEDPIGKRFRSWRDENVLREVVGVVPDVRYYSLGEDAPPAVYVPHGQNSWSSMGAVVRTRGNPADALPAIRATIQALDPDLAVAEVSTLAEARSQAVAAPRFTAQLLTVFAALALLLASIGIYGVLAYGVSQRTREFGVRMALGARARDVIRLVLSEAFLLVAAGLAIGLATALVAGRWLGALLYETSTHDLSTHLVVVALLGTVAIAASWLPAWRATRVTPTSAMRQE